MLRVGIGEGEVVGEGVGSVTGLSEGDGVGPGEGETVGEGVGRTVGPGVGALLGPFVGGGSMQKQFSPSHEGICGARHRSHKEQSRHSRLEGSHGSMPDQLYLTDPKIEGWKIGTSPARMTTSYSSLFHGISIRSVAEEVLPATVSMV